MRAAPVPPLLPTCRRALQEFLDLLKVDYKAGFTCPVCSGLPHEDMVIICDGKVLGFRRDLALPSTPETSGRTVMDL